MDTLLEETRKELEQHDKTFDDVIFIGDNGRHTKMSVDKFIEYSNIEYNNGYGIEEINTDLILVGKDFWLERHSYDDSEWWEYKSIPDISNFEDGTVYILENQKWRDFS